MLCAPHFLSAEYRLKVVTAVEEAAAKVAKNVRGIAVR